jgi:hypothetical protein
VRFRADGLRYAVAESAAIGGTQVCSYDAALRPPDDGRYCLATGVSSGLDYLPDGRIVMSRRKDGREVISLVRPEDGQGGGVERDLVVDPSADLESPSSNATGTVVAVASGGIVLYDTTTGALLRRLTTGPDASPAFSPDGTQVAFDRGGWIYTVPTAASARSGRTSTSPRAARS